MKEYRSDKNCLNILRLLILILTAALLCLCTYFVSFIPKLMIFLNILFFAAGFFFAVIYLPAYFKNLCYYLDTDKTITKVSGFFFLKKQIMAIDSIQYTTSMTTPFIKLPGLNFYVLYAYGGIMTIMFISNDDFNDLSYKLRR